MPIPVDHRRLLGEQGYVRLEDFIVAGRAGDLVVMNSHLWHGGTANRTHRRRLALHAFYCRWDKPQQQYQKALLSPRTQAGLSAQARAMLVLDDPDPRGREAASLDERRRIHFAAAEDAMSAEGGRSGFMK